MEDFKHLFNLEEINEVLDNKYRDPYPKEIGDRVSILDFSSVTYMNGRELDLEDDEQMNFNFITEFIVIETRQNHQHDAYFKKYRQDLVIVNSITNTRFRVNRGHVKIN
jgi:hypothetical protein